MYLSTSSYSSDPAEPVADFLGATGGGTPKTPTNIHQIFTSRLGALAVVRMDRQELTMSDSDQGNYYAVTSNVGSHFTYALAFDGATIFAVGNLGRVMQYTQNDPDSDFTSTNVKTWAVGIRDALYTSVIAIAPNRLVIGASGLYFEVHMTCSHSKRAQINLVPFQLNMATRSVVRLFFLDNFPQITAVSMGSFTSVPLNPLLTVHFQMPATMCFSLVPQVFL